MNTETRTVTLSADVKREVAEAIVDLAHPGHSKQYNGNHYTDGVQVWWNVSSSQFSPWADDAEIACVDEFVGDDIIYSPVPMDADEWRVASADQYNNWEAAYKESEAFTERYGDDEPGVADVIAWAEEEGGFKADVEAARATHLQENVDFVFSEMADSVDHEYTEGYCEVRRVA